MRLGVVLPLILSCTALLSQTDVAVDDLAKPYAWPMLTSTDAGLQFFLRTRWADGVLQYVVTLADGKGRLARWFSKHPDTGPIARSSFQTTFSDEAAFAYLPSSLMTAPSQKWRERKTTKRQAKGAAQRRSIELC